MLSASCSALARCPPARGGTATRPAARRATLVARGKSTAVDLNGEPHEVIESLAARCGGALEAGGGGCKIGSGRGRSRHRRRCLPCACRHLRSLHGIVSLPSRIVGGTHGGLTAEIPFAVLQLSLPPTCLPLSLSCSDDILHHFTTQFMHSAHETRSKKLADLMQVCCIYRCNRLLTVSGRKAAECVSCLSKRYS